jgi:hypothetical protein
MGDDWIGWISLVTAHDDLRWGFLWVFDRLECLDLSYVSDCRGSASVR